MSSYDIYSRTHNHSDGASHASSTIFRRWVEEGGWEAEYTLNNGSLQGFDVHMDKHLHLISR